MATQFEYKIQFNAVGTTNLGQEISFLQEKTFKASVDLNYHSYESGKNISTDYNHDFIHDTVREMIDSKVQEHCLRYSIQPDTVKILSYQIISNTDDVEVYFNRKKPSKQTTDNKAYVYAYYINDTVPPAAPFNLQAIPDSTQIILKWEMDDHHHGVRIYDKDKKSIGAVQEYVNNWAETNLESNKLYTYYVASYNKVGESELVEIQARTTLESGTVLPPPFPTYEESSYEPIEGETETLPSFQSGVGDRTDLLLKTSRNTLSRETFSYDMQLKGYEENLIHVYREREFQYRIVAEDMNGNIIATSAYRIGVVDGQEPLNQEGAGKKNLRLPLEIRKPETDIPVRYTVELIDPSETITYEFDKGLFPYTEHLDDNVTFYTTEHSQIEKLIRTPYYGPRIKGKGLYHVTAEDAIYIQEELPSATYDPVLSSKDIVDWDILINSSNPNVKMIVSDPPENYKDKKRFIHFKLHASVINPTQTPWNPSIHNGYYYLNQSEHYLYSETKVKGQALGSTDYVPYKFVYGINVEGTRTELGKLQEWKDRYRADFKGEFIHTVFTDKEWDTSLSTPVQKTVEAHITLDTEPLGSYISDIKSFKNTTSSYQPIDWSTETPGTSRVDIFTQVQLEDGSWSKWTQETKTNIIQSPLAKNIRYKFDLTQGEEKVSTTTDYLDTDTEDFNQGILENPSPVLTENIEALEGYILLDNLENKSGTFTSRTFDFGNNLEYFSKVTFVGLVPPGDGGELIVYTATSSTNSDWETATWQPILNLSKQDDTYLGDIQSPPKRYLKYQVRLKRSTQQLVKEINLDTPTEFNTGQFLNTKLKVTKWDTTTSTPVPLEYGGIILDNTALAGSYISPAMAFENILSWQGFKGIIAMPDFGGSVVIKTATSDNQSDLSVIQPDDARWVALNADGSIASPIHSYIAVKVELEAGVSDVGQEESPLVDSLAIYANTYEYLSPLFHSFYMIGNTYYYKKVNPKVYWVYLGGTYKDIYTTEQYSTSIASEIPSDGQLHLISDKTIKEIAHDALVKQGVNQTNFSLEHYRLTINPNYGVSLSSRDKSSEPVQYENTELEKGYVYAETTNVALEKIYNELRIEIDENNEAIITPIPQQGSPVIIVDNNNNEYIYTSFYTEEMEPTLICTEEMISNSVNELYLGNYHVDGDTLFIEFYNEKTGKWNVFKDFDLHQNYVKLYPSLKPGTLYRVSYKLKNSYYIDYNYDAKQDYAKIVFHRSGVSVSSGESEVKVIYETNKQSAYYYCDEINLNPLKNIQNAGFIYITDYVEKAMFMDAQVSPDVLFSNGKDVTWVRVFVKDRFKNPVADEEIKLFADMGSITMIQSRTDINGMAIAKYNAPTKPGVDTIIAINEKSKLESKTTIQLIPDMIQARMSIKTNKETIEPAGYWDVSLSTPTWVNAGYWDMKLATPVWVDFPGYEVEVSVHLFGYNQEPVDNAVINISCSEEGLLEQGTVTTNPFGEATVNIRATDIPKTGYITITAYSPEYDISESTVLRIKTFRDYHSKFFARGNHLIDIYDRKKARENLGITQGSQAPDNPELHDLWIDDMNILYLIDSYNLSDLVDYTKAKDALGIYVGNKKLDVWPNDIWIDKEKGDE